MRRAFMLVFLTAVLATIHAQTYHTKLLQTMAERLNLPAQLADDTLSQLKAPDGRMLNVRRSTDGQICHLGLPLFSPEMRTLMPSPIYDYLEQALLDHHYHISANTLSLQKIIFYSGSWQSLETILPTDICNISNLEGKQYVVSWTRDNTEIAKLTIPINYELLANSSRREMEETFVRDLKTHQLPKGSPAPITAKAPIRSLIPDVPSPTRSLFNRIGELKSYGEDSLLILQGKSYLRPFINRNTFYKLQPVTEQEDSVAYEELRPVLVADRKYPQETMANLLMTDDTPCQLQIEVQRSDYRHDTLSISLQQWQSFCQEEGCTPYFAFEAVNGQEATGMVIMHNAAKGYDHLLYLQCPLDTIDSEHPLMTGKLYLYLPNNNILNLFAETPATKSTPKKIKEQ